MEKKTIHILFIKARFLNKNIKLNTIIETEINKNK